MYSYLYSYSKLAPIARELDLTDTSILPRHGGQAPFHPHLHPALQPRRDLCRVLDGLRRHPAYRHRAEPEARSPAPHRAALLVRVVEEGVDSAAPIDE